MKRIPLCTLGVLVVRSALGYIADDAATDAIVGEAANQPYLVKLGVAGALRNRGTLQGVYGVNAAHNQSEPAWVWRDAQRAWTESAERDITHGATHFGTAGDVATGIFAGMKLVCIIGTGKDRVYFYK